MSQRTRMSTLLLSWLCLMMAMYNLGARILSMLGFHTGSPSTKYQRKKNDRFCNLPIWKCLITNDLTSLKWCVCSFLDNAWSFYGTYCRRMHIFRPWVTCVSGFGWGCMEASHHRWKKRVQFDKFDQMVSRLSCCVKVQYKRWNHWTGTPFSSLHLGFFLVLGFIQC